MCSKVGWYQYWISEYVYEYVPYTLEQWAWCGLNESAICPEYYFLHMRLEEWHDGDRYEIFEGYKLCMVGDIKNAWHNGDLSWFSYKGDQYSISRKYFTRCGRCRSCVRNKKGRIYKKWMDRHGFSKKLYLWTLGTNWEDTPDNRRLIAKSWNSLNKFMLRKRGEMIISERWLYNEIDGLQGHKWLDTWFDSNGVIRWNTIPAHRRWIRLPYPKIIRWSLLFKVIESGRGGFLHIHFISNDDVDHGYLRERWSKVTGIENPNVNYQSRHSESPFKAIGYLLKYVLKDGVKNYSWLGVRRKKNEIDASFE